MATAKNNAIESYIVGLHQCLHKLEASPKEKLNNILEIKRKRSLQRNIQIGDGWVALTF